MPRSNSVIRRYTPPTCTLEILAQSSPLSRLMGKTVLKQLRFQLHFDDPRIPEEKKIVIKGDRDQLAVLCDTVTSYVQGLLQKSADSFWVSIADTPELNSILGESTPQDAPTTKTLNSHNTNISDSQIYIAASSQLTHKLYFGVLGNQTSSIELTLLQLFDLASALDEYSADVLALPNLEQDSSQWKLPNWTPIAALLILAVGLTPITWQYASKFSQNQSQVAKTTTKPEEKLAIQPTPPISLTTPQTAITPLDNSKSLPNLNTPIPTAKLPPASASFPNPTVPPSNQTTNQIPLSSFPNPTVTPSNQTKIQPPLSSQPAFIIPEPTNRQIYRRSSSGAIAQNQNRINIPSNTNWPTSNTNISSDRISRIPQPVAVVPRIRTADQQPISVQSELRPLDGITQPPSAPLSQTQNDSFAANPSTGAQQKVQGDIATDRTLFDTPQVAEARQYLKKQWQPPEGFTDTLEYSLIVDVDGSIARILPLNQAARVHIDISGIPEIGKPFVSPSGQQVRLRAVFNPDGKVQTFPESP